MVVAMKDFASDYRKLFSEIGAKLTARDGCPEARIVVAEQGLGVRVPRALRDYYLVAGRERRFNQIHNRFLAPDDWFVTNGHLAFLDENQSVVFWGVRAVKDEAIDPWVFQGVNDDPIEWQREHRYCSIFLKVMVLWHGANGGAMPHIGSAAVPARFVTKLDRDWEFVGEVNRMRAYHRPGQVACFVEWSDIDQHRRNEPPWRVFVGEWTKAGLDQIAQEWEVTFEESGS